jgi:hypothetical protein
MDIHRLNIISTSFRCGKSIFSTNCRSFSKPDRLQNIAWFTLIEYMKKIEHPKGPYEAARKYLPYNSQIRCPFVKPEKDEKTAKRVKYE